MEPNVLLVVLDTVRARNVGRHGHANGTTPFLDRFARERATAYEQAHAPASRSLDSHVSIFTGLPVEEHGVVKSTHKLAPGNTIFKELSDRGYDTGVFTENSWLTDVDAGLKDAFDTVEGPRNVPFPDELDPTSFVVEHGQGQYTDFLRECFAGETNTPKALANGLAVKLGSDYPSLLPTGSVSTPAETYVDLFLDWAGSRDGPWAACVNLMDAHHPYEPRSEHDHWGGEKLFDLQDEIADVKWEFNGGQRPWWQRRALEGLYDGCLRQLDAQLERLVGELERRGELDDTLLVVTSDHGEGFGEPSQIRPGARVASHSVGLHEVLLHVPLVVRYPGQERGETVSEPASVAEFPNAVRAALDDEWAGTEFVPDGPVVATVHGLDEPVQERASRYCDDLDPFVHTGRVVYERVDDEVRKYVDWNGETATITVRDAQVSYVSAPDDGGRVAEVFDGIEPADVREGGSGFDELDAETTEHLEDLGYA